MTLVYTTQPGKVVKGFTTEAKEKDCSMREKRPVKLKEVNLLITEMDSITFMSLNRKGIHR